MIKPCTMYHKIALGGGKTRKTKVRCGYDGSIRNQCRNGVCPHFQPTFWWKLMKWSGRKRR